MDMYYHLKEVLSCQECNHPLKHDGDTGYLSYTAVCVGCGKEYEIDLEIKLKGDE
jgi:uncharacterized protein YbaR (Trm112 family)